MSLNPMYVTAPSLQQYFVDKDTGMPLSGGKVFYYRDVARTTPKDVYELQGNSSNYTYSPLPNPVILSAGGTIQDNNGNDVIPYYYPYDSLGDQDLYYIVVQSSTGVPQFTRSAWPNPENGNINPGETAELLNLIPNGQFLAHTDLPNNALVAGTNPIAQGGFNIILDNSISSVNTLTFVRQNSPSDEIPTAPRYVANFVCVTAVGSESVKSFSIEFKDVNKFSYPPGTYTFGFWAEATSNTNIAINAFYNYGTGGTPSASRQLPIAQTTITTTGTFYQFVYTFASNDGFNLGTNDDDFVSIDIDFQTNVPFNVSLTDFVLLPGSLPTLDAFPVQTDADMLTRGVAGWMNTPEYDGSDLYLPLILTRYGMEFDHSQIGMIFGSPLPILSPDDTSSTTPFIPCNGDSYIDSDYSALGIPYSRLGNYLRANGFVDNYPAYGTGTNYATGWAEESNPNAVYIIVNSPGTPVNIAASVDMTGITYSGVITYNGAQIGRAAYGYDGNWNGSTGVIALGNFVTPAGAISQIVCSFNPTVLNINTGLLAFQNYAFSLTCTAASTLVIGSGNYASITFNNSTGSIAINYRVAGFSSGTLSTGTVATIIIDLDGTETNAQVAQLTSYAISALQVSKLVVGSLPPAGSSFTFQSNPAAIRTLQAYFAYSASTPAPNPAVGELIRIVVPSSPTISTVAAAIYDSINSYQYAVPDLEGMFLRGVDPNSNFDLDRLSRLSQGVGPGGLYGSYQLDQFLSHNHTATLTMNTAGAAINPQYGLGTMTPATLTNAIAIANSGGTETRPVNSYVYWSIKY